MYLCSGVSHNAANAGDDFECHICLIIIDNLLRQAEAVPAVLLCRSFEKTAKRV